MSKAGGQVLKEMVEVTIAEVELAQDAHNAFTLSALSALDCFDDHVSGDDVGHAVGLDFIGADLEVFFVEEGVEVHGAL